MNNTENQPQTISTKERLKKLSQYTGTLIGASALVAAGALAVNNPDKNPGEQHNMSKISDEAPVVVPGTNFDTLKGTELQLKPSPRRINVTTPSDTMEASPVHVSNSTNEVHHIAHHVHEATPKHENHPTLVGDVVLQAPPTEAPSPTPETPAPLQ